MYIHELPKWPNFSWDAKRLANPLAAVHLERGRLTGRMEALGFKLQEETVLQTLTEEVVKSSEIEGERLDADQVRSSIARRLGMDAGSLQPVDRNVEGVVEMMLDATRNYTEPLTTERLFSWHAGLFPTGRSGINRIIVGAWRDSAMEVASRAEGAQRVHFEAPSAQRVEDEMTAFLDWLNADTGDDPVLKSGLAHLRFVTIHPFDDGNGRIARAIADMALARSEHSPERFYSVSAQILQEHSHYYQILEQTQTSSLDVTEWLAWFLSCLGRAIEGAKASIARTMAKARLWDSIDIEINERQRTVLNRLLGDFVGKLTSSKYAVLAKCSQDTASRDIAELVGADVLVRNPEGGRSTSYFDLKK